MLTDLKIKRIENPPKRYFENDGGGLFLDVLPSGVRSWVFQYRLAGRQEKLVLGRYPAMSLRQARNERTRYEADVLKGKSPVQEKRQGRFAHLTDPTVKDFCDRYYREQVAPNLKDPTEILRYLNNEICPFIGKLLLKDVGVLDCQRIIYAKRDKGKTTSALRVRACLKQMFDYALELRLVAANPAAQCATKYIGKVRKRTRALSPAEIRIVLRTIDAADIQTSFKLALRITLLTLTRKSELRLAEWKHINYETAEWFIPAANTKTNKDHVVYMSAQVADLFRELQVLACGSEYVLPGRSTLHKPMHENTLNGVMERIEFGIPEFTIHDLRRTASTILHGNRFQPDCIEVALGHQIGGMRGVYCVADFAPERRRMLAWWADYIDGLVNESNVVVGNFSR